MMMSPHVLSRSWAPSVETLVQGVSRDGISCNSLFPASRIGWEEKRKNTAGSKLTRPFCKQNNGRVHFAPHFSAARACLATAAAVSGGEEKVLLQPVPEGISSSTTTSPSGHRSGFMYRPFVDFAVEELSRRPDVSPILLKKEFRNMTAQGVTAATIDNKAFTSSKIRMFRIASIDTGPMQVLNVAGFARPEYDLPIFCADFFSVPNMNIIVLDLNPLYNTAGDKGYKERFYTDLLPLANKYIELLPWGDKLTAESLQFFSPLVLWTKPQSEDVGKLLYPAFQDYLQAWLNMVDSAHPTIDPVALAKNQEAQHRYISWRTTKDPGRPLLTKLYGEQLAESYIEEFLFSGHSTLGPKSFLDYFPEYRGEDGSMYKQRSMIGRSFETRPWDKDGNFDPK
ncbi:unnamed protein product [Calypogeia fissa]